MTKEKYIPYEKLSKKAKQELNNKRRGSWGETCPVTKIVPNKKSTYNRQAFKKGSLD